MAAFWIQCLLFGLYGCLAVGGMSVYEIEEWSLLRVSVMHYLMIVIGYLVMSWILCFGNGVFDNLIVIGIMSGVYFVIWLINWMSYRKRIRRLNEMLEERKRREEIKETESGENNIEKISRRIKK
jgi:positive regulator of sigma E activity